MFYVKNLDSGGPGSRSPTKFLVWYSGRGVGIHHRNRRKRQKKTFGGLRASMHDLTAGIAGQAGENGFHLNGWVASERVLQLG